MATVSELLIRARLEDQVSQASRDAAKSLREVADAGDAAVQGVERVSAAVRRSGQAQSEYARGLQQAQQAEAGAVQATEGRIRALERLRAAQAAAASGPQGDASWLSTIEEGASAASAGLSKLGIDLGPVTDAINKAKTAATSLYGVFTGSAGLIPAIGAVATAATAAYAVYSNWSTITDTLSTAFNTLTGRIRDQGDAMKGAREQVDLYMRTLESAGERQLRLFNEGQAQRRQAFQDQITQLEAERGALQAQMGATRTARSVDNTLLEFRRMNPSVGSPDWNIWQSLERQQAGTAADAAREAAASAGLTARIEGINQALDLLRRTLGNFPTMSAGSDEYNMPPAPDRPNRRGGGGREADRPWDAGDVEMWLRQIGNEQEEEARKRAEEVAKRYQREEDRAQRELDRTVERFGDGIADALVDGLFNGAERGKSFADRIGDFLKRSLSRTVAETLSSEVVQPIVRSVIGGGRVIVSGGGAGYGPGYGGGITGDANVYNGTGVAGYSLPAAAQGGAGYGSYLDLAGRGGSLFGGNLFGGSGTSGVSRWVSDIWNRPVSSLWGGGSAVATLGGGGGGFPGIDAGMSMYGGDYGGAALDAIGAVPQASGGLTIGQAAMGFGGIALGGYGMYQGLQAGGPQGYANAAAGAAGVVGGGATLAAGMGVGGAAMAGVAAVAPYVALIAAAVAMMLPAKETNPGAAAQIQVDGDGRLYVGKIGGKHVDVSAFEDSVNKQLTDIQKLLNAGDIKVSNLNYDNNRNWVGLGQAANMLPQSVQDVIWNSRSGLTSDNPAIEQVLRSSKITSFEQMLGGATWVQQVYDPLMKYGEAVSSYAERVKQLTATFEDAIKGARDLGIAETDLVKKRGEALADLEKQRAIDTAVMQGGLDARRQTVGGKTLLAQLTKYDLDTAGQRRALEDQLKELDYGPGVISNRLGQFDRTTALERQALIDAAKQPLADQRVADRVALMRLRGQDERAALTEFDYNAGQRRDALIDRIKAASTDPNAVGQPGARALIVQLEERLAEERLQVIAQFHRDALTYEKAGTAQREAAMGSATGVVTQIADYARGLAVGNRSPLSPLAQMAQANTAFDAVAARAARGDIAGAAQLPGVADALLGAARGVYGSGEGYARVFDRVKDTLEKFASQTADTLTRSAFAEETRSAASKLEEAIERLRSEVKALRQDQQQQRSAPARVAA